MFCFLFVVGLCAIRSYSVKRFIFYMLRMIYIAKAKYVTRCIKEIIIKLIFYVEYFAFILNN